jgi:triosephosphate isomerase
MRTKIVAGNWKMNKTLDEAIALSREVKAGLASGPPAACEVVLCVPFPFLAAVQSEVAGSTIKSGAQNCSEHDPGAYTGEVSAAMLKSMKTPYVIVGHSERRQYFGETDPLLAVKVTKALANGLTPIFCCGEPLQIRESGTHEALVKKQVEESLFGLSPDQLSKVVIAYEPVWAIGTGKTATSQQAQDMHAVIRGHVAGKFGQVVAGGIPILYGGSVKPDNAKELFSCPDVDGGLIGGASLKASDFLAIVRAC